MRAIEAIKSGSQLLRESKVESHILDSELLLAKILKKSREEILINLDQSLTAVKLWSKLINISSRDFFNIFASNNSESKM